MVYRELETCEKRTGLETWGKRVSHGGGGLGERVWGWSTVNSKPGGRGRGQGS